MFLHASDTEIRINKSPVLSWSLTLQLIPLFLPISSFSQFFLFCFLSLKRQNYSVWDYLLSVLNTNYILVHNKNIDFSLSNLLVATYQYSFGLWAKQIYIYSNTEIFQVRVLPSIEKEKLAFIDKFFMCHLSPWDRYPPPLQMIQQAGEGKLYN